MRRFLGSLILVFGMTSVALGAGNIEIPAVGPLARMVPLYCENGADIELRRYDFEPRFDKDGKKIEEEYYQAQGVGFAGELDLVVVFFLPERDPDPAQFKAYIDADQDGKAEEIVSYAELIQRLDNSWCNLKRLEQ